jgi:putative ABC transport system ATP-binding protein
LGLADRLRHLPNQLSGGQQQRVAVGRALIAKPTILLADEPTGNLDSQNATEIMDLLDLAHSEQGQTILLVTHNPDVAARADYTLFMSDGRLAGKKEETV